MTLTPIAHIHTDFGSKFGVPRQSGVVPELTARIVFLPEYRNPDALRGIEDFSHLWLIWHFSEVKQEGWSPTVRPPRLGGNTRMGVFATRSPYRPNPLGLSSVRLVGVDYDTPEGPVIRVAGADLMDGTPLFDIKPYLSYTDSHPDAAGGFVAGLTDRSVQVVCDEALLTGLPEETRTSLLAVLRHDPRPTYQNDPDRIYGMDFAGHNVRFTVAQGVLTVVAVEK
ncbi:MAG: tRNA (N6-threonylcarbamoyladenosine(37)-N6)-methyltransferase TrmO [Ruminococcaceae bacterium]|nr:tRNA (N6-threonylcarbamoyladenosine(37)-N6)-methyltransferase TrmO [Oscillospiraceae bacterium]